MKWKTTRASKDLVIISTIFILVSVLVDIFGLFEIFQEWVREHPLWEKWHIHNQLFLLVFLAIALGIFSLRRAFDLKREIAERKRTGDLLKRLQEEQKIILDSVPAWIFYKDTENRFVRVNKTFADVMQMTKEQLEGKSMFELYPKEQADAFWKDDKEVMSSGKPKMNIIEPMDSLKGKLWVQTDKIPYRDIKGNIIGVIGFAIDITGHKLAEESLKESYELTKSLLRTIPFGMDIVDEEGSVLFQSENLQKLFGKEVIGKKCWELYRDDKTQCCDCPLHQGIKIGETVVQEVQGFLGGKIFEISHTAMMFHGKKAIMEIFMNITERKQAEIQIQKYAEELRLLNTTKDKFFSIIAHDLKNPFVTILGFSELLLSDYAELSDEERKYYIEEMKKSADLSHNLLQNLLQWSRAQTGRIEFNPQKLNLYNIVHNITELLKSTAERKKIRISFNIPEVTTVFADEDMLNTIIRNLLTNAIKFTSKDGSVEVTAVKQNRFTEIVVSDTGVGMSNTIREKLFKLDAAQSTYGTDNEAGTGLGLILCKEFVEKHGGKIWVESVVDKGSKFIFSLPRVVGSSQSAVGIQQ